MSPPPDAAAPDAHTDDARQVPSAPGRLPDFFIVGHEKCGTTALYDMIKPHPAIFMPELKEPRFFSPDMRFLPPGRGAGRTPPDMRSYRALFAPAGPHQRVGEASPQYLGSKVAAERIAAVQPAARIVAILREPVSFLHAIHRQNVRGLLEDQRDLPAAMALEDARREGRVALPGHQVSPVRLLYSEHIRYLEQLRRFEEHFPSNHILVLIYERYRRENEATVRQVWRFLGVDDTVPVHIPSRSLERKTVRFMPLHRLSRSLKIAHHRQNVKSPFADALYALTPPSARELWRRMVYAKTPRQEQDPHDLELRGRLKPAVQALAEHLGLDLVTIWGYDRL